MMRITNSIIHDNSKYNINSTKVSVDSLNTQMTDQKKIHNPSEDPVVAIRSLRLRGQLSQIEQYYERNIPDANAWIDTTETALINMEGIVSDVYNQCTAGANDPLEKEDRRVILSELKELQSQIYSEGNADYAGRSLFTGYRTGDTLTFMETDNKTSYNITEKFTADDIELKTYVNNSPDVKYGTVAEISEADMPNTTIVNRICLGYTELNTPAGPGKLTYVDSTGSLIGVDIEVKSIAADGDAAYNIATGDESKIYFIPETGELILGSQVATDLRNATDISFSYSKTGFKEGELKPEHYYDCTKTVDSNGDIVNIEYVKEANEIDYTISFNQTITINTEGSNVFDSGMARSIDDMIEVIEAVDSVDEKISNIKAMLEDANYSDDESQRKLQTMLDAANKERDILDDKLQKLFESNISKWQGYMDSVNKAISDCGSRASRIELTETRMASQKSTVEKLKSTNDDRELSDIIVDYTSAQTAYQASLQATSKALKTSLLDYI